MKKGQLRVYLGASPGVGKTYAMLDEGHRRRDRGTDVVIGVVETHGRRRTAALITGLETIPLRDVTYRGTTLRELDVAAVLARGPEVVLVDELAHTNAPGSDHEKRWQDVEELLKAGIDVITTVNVQHLESLNDVVNEITGVRQRETVPDGVVRVAEQIELVDMSPEALRRRMAHGNVYSPDKVDAALAGYFRIGNLTALRELALLWLADQVDVGLQRYRADHRIDSSWPARERVVVALTGGPEGDTLIRRGARIAARAAGGDLLVVHVLRSDGLSGHDPAALARQRRLAESLGGTYHAVHGDDVAAALLAFAQAENATQLVLGASRRSRLSSVISGSIGAEVVRLSGKIDVHIVTHEEAARRRRIPAVHGGLTWRRRILALLVAAVVVPLLTGLLWWADDALNLTSDVLLFLLMVVVIALIGGALPAVVTAVVASLILNFFFTDPTGTFTIAEPNNVLSLIVFVAVAALVSSVVDLAARRAAQARRAAGESQLLAALAATALQDPDEVLPALLERTREAFGFSRVVLVQRGTDDGEWHEVAQASGLAAVDPDAHPDVAEEPTESTVDAGSRFSLRTFGRAPAADERRVLAAVAALAGAAAEQQRLAVQAAAAEVHRLADQTRSALLTAVGHDLRSPLASAKIAVTALRSPEIGDDAMHSAVSAELLASADSALDRLAHLVDDLLDLSRLQAGALAVLPRRIALDELVPLALDELGEAGRGIRADIPETLPVVTTDPGLLQRVLVNLLTNALRHGQPASAGSELPGLVPELMPGLVPELMPELTARQVNEGDGVVEVRVIDHGPGIDAADRERMFAPFQRLGDTDPGTGLGLGLAVARGLTEALGGVLQPEPTPGGGLTMVVRLPIAGAE